MTGKSVSLLRIKEKSQGYSLLEIIIVLAFIGIILAAAATYAKRVIDERTRELAAGAVAQEVYGVLQLVNADNLTTAVTNPLYDPKLVNNAIYISKKGQGFDSLNAKNAGVSPYISRTYSVKINSAIVNPPGGAAVRYSHSLNWSEALWGNASVRHYFTDSSCQGGGTANPVYFNAQYLTCREDVLLRNGELRIPRIDFISSDGTEDRLDPTKTSSVSISRVDVYVQFTPADGNPLRIGQFITPLLDAFKTKKIMPDTSGIYLVRQSGISDNSWVFLSKSNQLYSDFKYIREGVPEADIINARELPEYLDKLPKGRTYAIRFSFNGRGDYLRTDGMNSAEKVCWNSAEQTAGPCITSPTESSLILKQRKNPNELADLQVRDVVLKGKTADGKDDEYYTAPKIQYAKFTNAGQLGPYYKKTNPDKTVTLCDIHGCDRADPTLEVVSETGNGAISLPVQVCPVAEGFNNPADPNKHQLYPRLSVAVSSVISGIKKKPDDSMEVEDGTEVIFPNQAKNMVLPPDISINRLGGVVLQVRQSGHDWRISGLVASEDTNANGHSWTFYNPRWLSVVVTSWCSSVPQP
ncbi:type II secretion system protein [Salmonella enterica subsp. enterica serovar Oranienburg]|nr:type II secretion system protein [Salmonella enterica subsp. enterica serovar Oranienburg]ECW6486543.1 type II secretion system protein [Salmonella enterica subsp. enterica serovar Rubislaw]EEA7820529.1 type II secretion system protein [Salmonella enterica subsp. enterica serovar Miami]EBV1655900.1 type II secretion system protein [Salmonella enterica subsp. enterica serovar Oranienburg]EBW7315173.1 type II secretion system protein [Salmonella enterica subsp. enterica serovar Oranienburg]